MLNDPINFTDSEGTGPVACAAIIAGFEGYNVTQYMKAIGEINARFNGYRKQLSEMCLDEGDRQKRLDRMNKNQMKELKAAVVDYLQPSLTQMALMGVACAATWGVSI